MVFYFCFLASQLLVVCSYLKASLTNAGKGLIDKRFDGVWTIESNGRKMRDQKVRLSGHHLQIQPVMKPGEDKSQSSDLTGYQAAGKTATCLCVDNSAFFDPSAYLVFRCEFVSEKRIHLFTTTRSAVAAEKRLSKLKLQAVQAGEQQAPLFLNCSPVNAPEWLDSLGPQNWELSILGTRQ